MRLDVAIVRHLRGLVNTRAAGDVPASPKEPPVSKEMRAEVRAERLASKERAAVDRARRLEETAALRAAERRIQSEVSVNAFRHYLQVRDWARALTAGSAADGAGTPFARVGHDPRPALAPLWDATPEVVADLRRWSEPISGVRASDYEPASEELTRQLQREWMALRGHHGSELFVQESPALGGFGIQRYGQRVNEDTLRWFAAAIALQDGGVLGQFLSSRRRQLVWEIGGGWGGFAYAFKTLCPNVTYVITGVPEMLLVSAVYLMTVFPSARCRFAGPDAGEVWQDWQDVDFVFAPEWMPPTPPAPIDLTLDIMTLRGMSAAGVRAHVQHAYDRGSRYVYSLLSARQAPEEARRVWEEIGRLFWLHSVPPRGIPGIAYPPPAAPEGYVHIVGWRRMCP
jgi:putative sugar O-methyltransferase